ncbi:MAG: TonB-dependent siderophore receptor [Comamonadaceae bacterium]|nr:TonB-dependent siderophore receptor [Comamonadaceae bacterium]
MPLHCPLTPRALAAAALACALGAHAQSTPPAAAPQTVRSYDQPAQPLGSALARIGADSGQQISIDAELVRGRTAPAVRGSYTAEQAAQAALQGSGLALVRTGSGSWSLRVAPSEAPATPGAPTSRAPATGQTLGEVRVTAQPVTSPATEQTGSYTTRALTIGKMEQSIRETPQSVTVVTRQQMDDQNLTSVEAVVQQTTGAAKSQRNFGAHVYTMRGYVIPDTNFLIDGIPGGAYNPTGWVPVDTATFDRVEVLRGAGALAVGAGDPSGVVNMVRKRPRAEGHLDVAQSIGSWNHYRTEIDAGGALNQAGTVRGRVVAAYTDRDYFYDLAHTKAPLLYGVIDADLAPGTKATAGYRHQEQDITGYTIFQLPMYTDATSLGLPRSTSLGQYWNRHQATTDDVFAELEHQLAGDWRAKLTVNYSQTGIVQKLNTARGAVDKATGKGFGITSNYFVDRSIDATGLDANLTGSFSAFGGTHKALLGASWTEQKAIGRSTTVSMNIPVDIFNFPHGLIPEPATPAYASQLEDKVRLLALYGNARLEVAPRLHLHLGGRLNWYKYHTDDLVAGKVTNDYAQNGQLTPYVGVVYDLGPQWSLYASYASTFVPQSQYSSFNGGLLKPAEGDNYEAGIKGELMDRRLNVALALFHTKKRNVAVLDTDHVGGCPGITTSDCYRNASLLRSQGVDAEVAGRLAPGWEVAAGYTYLSTRDDAGEPLTADAPRNLLRAATSYTLPGEWSAWTVGANLSAQTRSYVTIVQNPGRAILDLRASYRIDPTWSVSLNVGNVFDKTYWEFVGGTRNGNGYGTPRNATLTLRGAF